MLYSSFITHFPNLFSLHQWSIILLLTLVPRSSENISLILHGFLLDRCFISLIFLSEFSFFSLSHIFFPVATILLVPNGLLSHLVLVSFYSFGRWGSSLLSFLVHSSKVSKEKYFFFLSWLTISQHFDRVLCLFFYILRTHLLLLFRVLRLSLNFLFSFWEICYLLCLLLIGIPIWLPCI